MTWVFETQKPDICYVIPSRKLSKWRRPGNKTKCREIIIILPLFGKLKKTSALGLFSWRPLSKKSPFDFLVPYLLSSAWSRGAEVVRQVVGKDYAFTKKKDYYVKNTEKTQRPSWEHLCAPDWVWQRWGQHVGQRQPLKSLLCCAEEFQNCPEGDGASEEWKQGEDMISFVAGNSNADPMQGGEVGGGGGAK